MFGPNPQIVGPGPRTSGFFSPVWVCLFVCLMVFNATLVHMGDKKYFGYFLGSRMQTFKIHLHATSIKKRIPRLL
jgi:hypothetical protein